MNSYILRFEVARYFKFPNSGEVSSYHFRKVFIKFYKTKKISLVVYHPTATNKDEVTNKN